jgi:hypothetical protein
MGDIISFFSNDIAPGGYYREKLRKFTEFLWFPVSGWEPLSEALPLHFSGLAKSEFWGEILG